mmetsp:Transcript_47265/g.154782  ORF Transcript_47265/g.154782 Transcript_47265/m.154782 type:complete len:267 (+) Transcript_47265:875-1675(+)
MPDLAVCRRLGCRSATAVAAVTVADLQPHLAVDQTELLQQRQGAPARWRGGRDGDADGARGAEKAQRTKDQRRVAMQLEVRVAPCLVLLRRDHSEREGARRGRTRLVRARRPLGALTKPQSLVEVESDDDGQRRLVEQEHLLDQSGKYSRLAGRILDPTVGELETAQLRQLPLPAVENAPWVGPEGTRNVIPSQQLLHRTHRRVQRLAGAAPLDKLKRSDEPMRHVRKRATRETHRVRSAQPARDALSLSPDGEGTRRLGHKSGQQ